MDDTIIKLQTIIGHHEEEIASLSKELYTQQKEIAAMRQQFTDLKERLQSLEDGVGDAGLEPPPPHY